jgi:hypothetical protein
MTDRRTARPVLIVLAATLFSGCLVYDMPVTTTGSYPPPQVRPEPTVEIRFFYDALDPYGDWMRVEPYGFVWVPNAVDPFWRPYTVGRWVWTDWGWTWVSGERWGWATYHYGRWIRTPHHGWVWVPGDVWGPGWVAWRRGTGVVGWAPLPPDVRFHAGVGLDWNGVDIDVAIGHDAWCFLDDSRFGDPDVQRYAYPVGRNATVIRGTKNVTHVRIVDKRIVNEGIDRAEIERLAGHPVPVRRVVDQPRPELRPAVIEGGDVQVYRPEVRPHDTTPDPPHAIAPQAPPSPGDAFKDGEAERKWDQRWNEDWRKLQKVQKRDVPPDASAPAAPPAVEKQHREENRDAADNAYRELVVEQERTKRKAERTNDTDGQKKAEPANGKAKNKKKEPGA